MPTNQVEGGPLDGLRIEGIPGPIAGMVLLYYTSETDQLASLLAGMGFDPAYGPRINRETFSKLLDTVARGCREYGIDPHELLAEIDARPPVAPTYVSPEVRRREPGGAD